MTIRFHDLPLVTKKLPALKRPLSRTLSSRINGGRSNYCHKDDAGRNRTQNRKAVGTNNDLNKHATGESGEIENETGTEWRASETKGGGKSSNSKSKIDKTVPRFHQM